jgi:hypothetical protein
MGKHETVAISARKDGGMQGYNYAIYVARPKFCTNARVD